MTELLKCPFCGGDATVVCASNAMYIACNTCNAIMGRTRKSASALKGKLSFDTKEEAIKAWNTRKPVQDVMERLENELRLADEEKERCARESQLQFDSAKGYATGIYNAIEIVKEGLMND